MTEGVRTAASAVRGSILVIAAVAVGATGLLVYEAVAYTGGMAGRGVAVLGACIAVVAACALSLRALEGRHRETVVNVWLAVISSLVLFVIVDLLAGWLLVGRLSPPTALDPVVHHRLVPGSESEFRTREFHYVQTVNSSGLRGPEIAATKPPDTYRILVLGDSFVMGKGVADDEPFPRLIGERLEGADGEAVQVLNAGVDSYTPLLSYLQLRYRLEGLEPDLVILALDMSDLVQEQAYRRLADFDDAGRPLAVDGTGEVRRKPSLRLRDWLYENTYLTRLALYFLQRRGPDAAALTVENTVAMASPELLAHTLERDRTDRDQQWDDLFESVGLIRDRAREIGADFLLVVYPWGHQVGPGEWSAGRINFIPADAEISDRSLRQIHRRSEALGIELLDAFPRFRDADTDEPLFYDVDMHFTPAGHRLLADALVERLAARPDLSRAGS